MHNMMILLYGGVETSAQYFHVCMVPIVSLLFQDEVLIAGFGRRGHAVGDIPGVRFKVRRSHVCRY